MKFGCPQCSTRYTIGDEKVPSAKVLRFSCKKCGAVIRLRRHGDQVEVEPPEADDSGMQTRVGSSQEIDKLRAVAADVDFGVQTRVASSGELNKLRAAARPGEDAVQTRVAALGELKGLVSETAREEWFTLVSGKQRGPMRKQAVLDMLKTKEIDRRTYVWREGMGDWQRLGVVDEFKSAAQVEGDAPWRVMSPLKDEAGKGETHAMDVRQLQEQLAKTRGAASGGAGGDERRPDPAASVDEFLNFNEDLTADEPKSPFPEATEVPQKSASNSQEYFAPADKEAAYYAKPPGESTRVFMQTAGLFKRQRTHRIAAIASIALSVLLVAFVSLDILGYIEIPGMGAIYDATGLVDPNADRAVKRVEAKLRDSELPAQERARLEALRANLTGKPGEKAKPQTTRAVRTSVPNQGVVDTKTLNAGERTLAAEIFSDERKQESKVKLSDPESIQVPNLPSGLTREAIFKVITDNTRSMSLCLAEAMRKGEKLSGKMEIELTISADGSVSEVGISSPEFRNSTMASCTTRRIKGWRFPRFNGEPVTVSYPYVLQMGF